jgi:hypothetical protein
MHTRASFTHPAALDAASVEVVMRLFPAASRLVRTTSPACTRRAKKGFFGLDGGSSDGVFCCSCPKTASLKSCAP